MKPFLLLLSLILSLTFSGAAADYHLELTPGNTKINWTLTDPLHTVHGTFKLKRGDIHFDPETGKAGGEVVVDATSGESGSSQRDSRMHKNVLESPKYPDVSFAPDHVEGKVELAGKSNVKLHGIFKIHGAAHEITVPVEVIAKDNQLAANLKFDVPYVAWGMKDPSIVFLKVGKSVEIEMQATAPVAATTAAR
jgi:polyisoprenoid-binding protein YceI